MKSKVTYNFNPEKNKKLIELREVSFEEIIAVIDIKGPLDVLENVKPAYKHQKIFVVELYEYIYLVPFLEEGHQIFLKTIIPSRKATKKYLSHGKEKNYDK